MGDGHRDIVLTKYLTGRTNERTNDRPWRGARLGIIFFSLSHMDSKKARIMTTAQCQSSIGLDDGPVDILLACMHFAKAAHAPGMQTWTAQDPKNPSRT